jgi:16S rRNA (adenine(1408)-N(1))-methyltransferase
VDVGAGDGGYFLHRARTEPATFAIAIDASPDALASGAWRAKRARLANAVFLVEGVERLPSDLDEVANEVTIHFPWGSLLRGLLSADPAVLSPIARLLKPGTELRVLLSATARDGHADLSCDALRRTSADFAAFGLQLDEARPARLSDIAASRSAWGKRLGASRPVVYARYSRCSSRRGLISGGTSPELQGTQSTRNRPS